MNFPVRPLPAVLLIVPAVAIFIAAYRRLWSYLTDDVFISVRYAQHLVEGHGLAYNVGERVEGYTNFLWTLLVAPGIGLGLGLVPWIKVMNALWALAAAGLAIRLTASLARGGGSPASDGPAIPPSSSPLPWWIVLPGALCLASSPFILSAAEGLETMMFSALLMLVVLWTWDAREDERLPRAGFAIVALGLTRPDGWAYLPWVIAAGRMRGRSWGWTGRMMLVAGAGLIAHEIFRIAYYGDPIPNTLHAKGGGTGFLLDRGWTQLVDFSAATGGWVWLVALLPLAWRASRGAGLALLGVIAIRVAFQLWSGGPWMARGRFLAPVLPLMMALLVWGTALALRRGWRLGLGLGLAAALVLLPGWQRHATLEAASLQYGLALRGAHQRLGADVAAHTDSSAVMAMDDAGLGPLVAGRTNIDMLGLNDRHIGRLRGEFGVKFDPQYVLDRRPDVVVLMSRRPPPIGQADLFVTGQAALFEDAQFRERYRYAREYVFAENYRLLLYVRTDSRAVRDELRGGAVAR
ncbi:MAG: hypothetical protein ABIS67_15480 [Candidatus Eisenbacteria bacterium]